MYAESWRGASFPHIGLAHLGGSPKKTLKYSSNNSELKSLNYLPLDHAIFETRSGESLFLGDCPVADGASQPTSLKSSFDAASDVSPSADLPNKSVRETFVDASKDRLKGEEGKLIPTLTPVGTRPQPEKKRQTVAQPSIDPAKLPDVTPLALRPRQEQFNRAANENGPKPLAKKRTVGRHRARTQSRNNEQGRQR
jgi:hypothetical protein